MHEAVPEVRKVGPLDPIQQRLSGHSSTDIIVTILTTTSEFERREKDSTRSCGG